MGFSKEWEETYKTGAQNSVWPWSEVVSMFYHYFKGDSSKLKVLELGCGAGANIPFFESLGISYFGIEGSRTQVDRLSQKYIGNHNITVVEGDFSNEIPFDEEFDLILDRAAVTHNSTEGIRNTLRIADGKLKAGGYYFGIGWFSVHFDVFSDESLKYEIIDPNTKVFHSGYYSGLGNVHFSDEKHIHDLFKGMDIVECYEKIETWRIPSNKKTARWNFVAQKRPEH